jgi:predicted cupin superfamily sugar epimerase
MIVFGRRMAFVAMMSAEVTQIIARHGLEPLPWEGGYFRRTWTSPENLPVPSGRPAGTAILYLMTATGFSALHVLDAGELWSYQGGDPIEHISIDPTSGTVHVRLLGPDPAAGHEARLVVPAGVWQGARPLPGGPKGWSLIAATMTPGWDPAGFILGDPRELRQRFPGAAEWIGKLSR